MIVRDLKIIEKLDRAVKCPNGGFISNRFLVKDDNMGFTLTKTIIPIKGKQHWHYKNHLEACYCIKGKGILTNLETNEIHFIEKDTMYALDKNDDHTFEAVEEVILICVFNPPLIGREVHDKNNSYKNINEFRKQVT